ncbi:putative protein TPRXL [Homarus americanus]|uniref:putative protein TPRXL n=1 Tax=Homarus americanus TaxID=6706 RepID=UPI001C44EA3C|nr:putative protein TPRXL [Homarus americanus]
MSTSWESSLSSSPSQHESNLSLTWDNLTSQNTRPEAAPQHGCPRIDLHELRVGGNGPYGPTQLDLASMDVPGPGAILRAHLDDISRSGVECRHSYQQCRHSSAVTATNSAVTAVPSQLPTVPSQQCRHSYQQCRHSSAVTATNSAVTHMYLGMAVFRRSNTSDAIRDTSATRVTVTLQQSWVTTGPMLRSPCSPHSCRSVLSKSSQPKPDQPKSPNPSPANPSPANPSPANPSQANQSGQPKPDQPKSGQPKPDQPKSGQPKSANPSPANPSPTNPSPPTHDQPKSGQPSPTNPSPNPAGRPFATPVHL